MIIKSQKEVYEIDRARLENEIAVLRTSNAAERVKPLETQLQETLKKIQQSDDAAKLIKSYTARF